MLRRRLREQFPQAHAAMPLPPESAAGSGPAPAAAAWPRRPDFPPGALTEVGGIGAGWLVALMLEDAAGEPGAPELALVDGADSFDPASFSADLCARMVWLRCRKSVLELARVADLLVADGNVPRVIVDASGLTPRELAEIPSPAWWRLRRSAERTGCRLVVSGAAAAVPAANPRWRLNPHWTLADLSSSRGSLLARLCVRQSAPSRWRRIS